MQTMQRFIRYIALSLTVFIVVAATPPALAEDAPVQQIIMSEVQTGGLTASGQEDPAGEFIELYNPDVHALSLEGMRLEYLSSGHTGMGEPTRVLAVLKGTLEASHFYLAGFPGYLEQSDMVFTAPAGSTTGLLARSGGHIRLVSSQGQIIDMLSWGSATTIGQYWKAPVIPAGMSVQRILPGETDYSRGKEFRAPSLETSPVSGQRAVLPPESDDPGAGQPIPCRGIVLTEILPNASGTDTGKEFIEVYNPTQDSVTLGGCTLQVGTGKIFTMPEEPLAASSYRVFYDTETALTLPNTTAQPVLLHTGVGTQQVLYPDNLGENQSWAFVNASWLSTMSPTPGWANVLQAEDPTLLKVTAPVVCGPGKERSPETNRCRTIPVPAAVTTCKAGYERNPATNRCRSISPASTFKLNPCKTGQERNPETNRCRAVASAAVTAKPCPSGQERSPETNRCRKAAVTGSSQNIAAVHDVISNPLASNYRWWIAGFVILVAAGYAVYEWRHDIYSSFAAWPRRGKPK